MPKLVSNIELYQIYCKWHKDNYHYNPSKDVPKFHWDNAFLKLIDINIFITFDEWKKMNKK